MAFRRSESNTIPDSQALGAKPRKPSRIGDTLVTSTDRGPACKESKTFSSALLLPNEWLGRKSRNVKVKRPFHPKKYTKPARWHRCIRNCKTCSQHAESNVTSEQEKKSGPLTRRLTLHSAYELFMLARGLTLLPHSKDSLIQAKLHALSSPRRYQEEGTVPRSINGGQSRKASTTSSLHKNDIGLICGKPTLSRSTLLY